MSAGKESGKGAAGNMSHETKLELVELGLEWRIEKLLERTILLDEAVVGLLGEAVTLLKRIEHRLPPRFTIKLEQLK